MEDDCLNSFTSPHLPLFNSHPHKEDDDLQDLHVALRDHFSTHILTRRMTADIQSMDESNFFSTHILTWRMTKVSFAVSYCVFFQLTSSQGG